MLHVGDLVATFVAGLLSFLSPCTVPLMPAYLACVSGVGAADLRGAAADFRLRLVIGSLLYVLGFAVVFVLAGTVIGGFGAGLAARPGTAGLIRGIELGGGGLLVVLGLAVAGVVRVPVLARERRIQLNSAIASRGLMAAFPMGALFGLAWTPCVGGYLAAALELAALRGSAATGAVLLFVYALGIGAPFVLVALIYGSMPSVPRRLVRVAGPLAVAGGVLTAALGVLVMTGAYTHLTSWLVQFSVPR